MPKLDEYKRKRNPKATPEPFGSKKRGKQPIFVVQRHDATRLLVRGGANPQKLTPETLREALPEIEEGLAVYLPREEIAAAIDELRALAAA